MTEDHAKQWLKDNMDVSRETLSRIENFLVLLRDEMERQNLIAEKSWDHVWARHVVDSAQLLLWADVPRGTPHPWLDLGTGAGFPGIIVAILQNRPVIMIESRRKRVAFLEQCVSELGLGQRATVIGRPLERIDIFPAAVISARAFAPLKKLLHLSAPFSTEKTVWLLPKGRNAAGELAQIPASWRRMFHVERSITDPEAGILVGQGGGKAYRDR